MNQLIISKEDFDKVNLEESHIQAAVFAFCRQGEALARRAQGICRGEWTAEEALTAEIG